jgi:glycosyltransferase involved in cell wall biosynthesis
MNRTARILEVTSYPPPRAGWGIRVEYVKKRLEDEGHSCVVVNIGNSRAIPSPEYETVLGGADFVRKVWRFCRRGYTVHAHANGDALKGLALALIAEGLNLLAGKRCVLTFHAGAIQRYFPKQRNPWLVPVYWLLFAIPRRIICNSEAVKECIASYGIARGKIVAIPAFSRQYMEFTPAPLPDALQSFMDRYPRIVFTYLRMRPLFYPVTLIEGMAEVMSRHPGVGLVVCGMAGHADEGVQPAFEAAIDRAGIRDRICLLDDLDHDAFLTVLQRSALYLRTPITDGVASSVLEALALGVPVVACDNGHRPAGVITFPATDASGLAAKVDYVLQHHAAIVAGLDGFDVSDTVADEVALLVAADARAAGGSGLRVSEHR